jgi:glycosyltransferase involved in cell wall biosynthesis
VLPLNGYNQRNPSKLMKIAYIVTHPIQYQVPLIRYLISTGLEIKVFFATDVGVREYDDEGFGVKVKWDLELEKGYEKEYLTSDQSLEETRTKYNYFKALFKEKLSKDLFSAVWVHGWWHASSVAAIKIAKEKGIPIMLRGETSLKSLQGGWARRLFHWAYYQLKFRSIDYFLAVSHSNAAMYKKYGVDQKRIFWTPYAVDNHFFQDEQKRVEIKRDEFRKSLGYQKDDVVLMYCAKMIDVKQPELLVRVYSRIVKQYPCTKLMMVGDGELRKKLEILDLALSGGQINWVGFKNQHELAEYYNACDIFVLPSKYEPWGLVVNEVMNFGKVVVASDRVGCSEELLAHGKNGFVYPFQDEVLLEEYLIQLIKNSELRDNMGRSGLEYIQQWSYVQDEEGIKAALNALAESL